MPDQETINKILFTLGLEKDLQELGVPPEKIEKIKEINGIKLDHFRAILSIMSREKVDKILYGKIKEDKE
jgi:hypothetical protein